MADDEKARLYKRLTTTWNEFEVLARMRHNGFWPAGVGIPQDPPKELKERATLTKELASLRASQLAVKDPEKALSEERTRRFKASLERRKAARARRLADEKTRRERWLKARKDSVVNLGEGVSAGLQDVSCDKAQLQARGLPVLGDAVALAGALGVKLSVLRWLTFHRRGATLVHYHRYAIPKKTGGQRAISAPRRKLAGCQCWVLTQVLEKLHAEPPAHGFVRHRSVVTNATPHVGRRVVVNLDLRDFFPSVTFRRVKGLFRKVGYGEQVATVLALLCTEPPRVPVTFDDKRFYVALGQRVLPQGASTSPAITNALCRRLDRRLQGLARRHGFTYTRYADDLTFSGDEPPRVGRLLKSVKAVVVDEGFQVHPTKTRVMRSTRRQEVTGVVVNHRVGVPRDELRALRATLHNCARHGLQSQNREHHADFAAHLRGKVSWVCMVDPARGPALRAALERALASP